MLLTKHTLPFAAGLFGLAAPLALAAPAASDDKAPKPNILLIFCDDLGYADVGFNAKLNKVETDVTTPALDKIASNGIIFRQAYVAHPFCGPSRMGLLSGRIPHTFGGQKNLPDASKNLEDFNEKGIPVSEVLMSTMLKKAGYQTGCIGKWHMGASAPFHPNKRGFDEFYGFLGGGHQYFPSVSDKVEPKINDYQYFLERNGKEVKSPEGAYLTDMLSDDAVDFISKAAKKDQPFFLYLAYNAPHSPLQGKTEDLKRLYPDHEPKNPKNGINFRDYEKRQNYVAMVYAVDRGVAKIMKTLRDPNKDGNEGDSIVDNTLIIFLSDNGGKILQSANNAPLQGDKGDGLEGGIRVPMFMHWPKGLPKQSVFDHPVLALDFYPTFARLAGATIPEGKKLDGKDIWPDFLANKNPHPSDTMFWLRHHGGNNEIAIRKGNLKVYRKGFGKWKVFDVVNDLGESKDLANSNADFVRSRVAEGATWAETHLVPQWHDTKKAMEIWNKNKMPKYEKSFEVK